MGRQRDGMAQLELRDESLSGSHRPGAADGHDRCRDQYGCVEQRKHDVKQEVQKCAVVLIMFFTGSVRSASHMLRTAGHGGCSFKRTFRRTMQDLWR